MKIQTHDGKIFDVPEENLGAFLQEYNDMTGYTPTNEEPETDAQRGYNFGGATRNFLAGLVPFSDEIEAGVRSVLPESMYGIKDYETALKNSRESRAGFAEAAPEAATALTIAGALGGALLPVGVAGQVAKGATLGAKMAAGAKTGAALGALYGFGEGQGGFENRLESGLWGGATGGVIGGLTPAVTTGLGNSIRRLKQNPLTEAEAAEGILSSALKPGTESEGLANIYADAARMGAKDIQRAASNLNEKIIEMQNWRNPELVEMALSPTWSKETPSIQKILSAIQSPSETAGTKAYSDWARNIPELSTKVSNEVSDLVKNNEALKRVVKPLQKYLPEFSDGRWTHDKVKMLSNQLEKAIQNDPDFKKTAYSIAAKRAQSQLDEILEKAEPGRKVANTVYRGGKNLQERAEDVAAKRVRQITQATKRKNPEISMTGAGRELFRPYTRGLARELLRNNGVSQTINPNTLRTGSALADALLRTGLSAENADLGHIGVVFENDPEDLMSIPRNFLEDEYGNIILMEN